MRFDIRHKLLEDLFNNRVLSPTSGKWFDMTEQWHRPRDPLRSQKWRHPHTCRIFHHYKKRRGNWNRGWNLIKGRETWEKRVSEKHSLSVKGVQLGPQKGILGVRGESFPSDKCVVIGWGPNQDSMMGLKHSLKAISETFKRFPFF